MIFLEQLFNCIRNTDVFYIKRILKFLGCVSKYIVYFIFIVLFAIFSKKEFKDIVDLVDRSIGNLYNNYLFVLVNVGRLFFIGVAYDMIRSVNNNELEIVLSILLFLLLYSLEIAYVLNEWIEDN